MYDPKLPPSLPHAAQRRGQVVDIAVAVARGAAVPVLDPVKRRMYLDWLRGLRPRQIQTNYRCPVFGLPRIEEVDDILRAEALRERAA